MSPGQRLLGIVLILAVLSLVCYWSSGEKDPRERRTLVFVSDNNPVRAAQVEGFNRENPGLNLVLDSANSGIHRILLQCSTGVGPDLFDFMDIELQTFVDAGVIRDITTPAEKMGFSVKAEGWPGAEAAGLHKDRQYAYYCNIGTDIIVYNKNVFDYFGVAYPKEKMTWDEFVSMAIKVNSSGENVGPNEKIFAVQGAIWRHYFESLHGEFFTPEGLLKIMCPELRAALIWHRDLVARYHIAPTLVEQKAMVGRGGWIGSKVGQFAAGRYAMMFNGDWVIIACREIHRFQMEEEGRTHKDVRNPLRRPLRLGAALVPHMPGFEPRYRIAGRMAGINNFSPNREAALKVLQYFAGPTYSKLVNEKADGLPGNPKYADLGVAEMEPDLARMELHDTTIKAMSFGYVQRRSPFLSLQEVYSAITAQVRKLEANPGTDIDSLMEAANAELQNLIRRRLEREPRLRRIYEECMGKVRSSGG